MSRWTFWVLAPVLVAFAVVMPLTVSGHWISYALSAIAMLTTLAMYDSDRFNWAGRAVAAVILIAYLSYFVSSLFGRGGGSILQPFLGLLVFGLPSLKYLVTGELLEPPPIETPPGHPLLGRAAEQARASLDTFRQVHAEFPEDTYVKFPLATAQNTEYLWAQVDSYVDDRAIVIFANTPFTETAEPFEPRQHRSLHDMVDWEAHLPDGRIRGGFSTQAMIHIARETGQRLPRRVRRSEAFFVDRLNA